MASFHGKSRTNVITLYYITISKSDYNILKNRRKARRYLQNAQIIYYLSHILTRNSIHSAYFIRHWFWIEKCTSINSILKIAIIREKYVIAPSSVIMRHFRVFWLMHHLRMSFVRMIWLGVNILLQGFNPFIKGMKWYLNMSWNLEYNVIMV